MFQSGSEFRMVAEHMVLIINSIQNLLGNHSTHIRTRARAMGDESVNDGGDLEIVHLEAEDGFVLCLQW